VPCSAGVRFLPGLKPGVSTEESDEWVGEHEVFLVDVSWDFAHDEDEPYTLSIYFTFELDAEDT
jgi:hypothetical protein